jgi:hypothetical protein
MDKSKVVSILAPYSPPLAPSQVETIAEEIVLASTEEATKVTAEAPKPARKKSRKS